eukprot:TRINITY_DN1895_c0_g1_i2.p1 TRINITY_DN1895_c0_g1~~TRINITY_DN1895_c0_g1_i2.p1  ORF type:complete len:277 (-),score=40.35 TRINITY_DN1895_c0_g1_i2:626-1456(-)
MKHSDGSTFFHYEFGPHIIEPREIRLKGSRSIGICRGFEVNTVPLVDGADLDSSRFAPNDSLLTEYGFCQRNNLLVTEYILDTLRDTYGSNVHISFNLRIHWIQQIIQILSELHDSGTAHDRLFNSNIYLKDNYRTIVLGNINLRKYIRDKTFDDFAFSAPEIIVEDNPNHNEASTIYSFGLVCYEIMCDSAPFNKYDDVDSIKKAVLQGERPIIPDHFPDGLLEIVHRCLSEDPNDRPTWEELMLLNMEDISLQEVAKSEKKWANSWDIISEVCN